MINRVVLVGRLTKDADLRYSPNGVAVANFRMAVNRPFSNKNGEKEADFVSCVVWRRTAENVANYTSKGSLIGVDGRIQTRTFDDQNGNTQFVTEVVADSVQFLESKGSRNKSSGQGRREDSSQEHEQAGPSLQTEGEPIDIMTDDLPF